MTDERKATDSVAPLVVFAGGGTGGHLYPALAIAEALRERLPRVRFRFFGTQRAIDRQILDNAQADLVSQQLPTFQRAPWRWPALFRSFRRVCAQCRAQFEADRPAVVVGSGGLSSVPAVRAAHRMALPVALMNPDAVPGRANRFLARSADIIFAQFEETVDAFAPGTNVAVLGCPVRSAFNRATREAGVARFGLDTRRKTLLITGASQGARTVNEAVAANLGFLEEFDDWQVIHLTGEADFETVRGAYAGRRLRAAVLAFSDHMADALAAADLVVGRAGASTLAELTAVGRGSILMPYPHHRDRHQLANARCLVRAQAARIVSDRIDRDANGRALRAALVPLMRDEKLREQMGAAARRLGRGQAAGQIADRLIELAGMRSPAGEGESVEAVAPATR